ncbi:MAG TPA: hypothetical protein K8U89_07310 [Brachybacterium faecium]|nr:hypothetical protein [Brachybacterium faecium]
MEVGGGVDAGDLGVEGAAGACASVSVVFVAGDVSGVEVFAGALVGAVASGAAVFGAALFGAALFDAEDFGAVVFFAVLFVVVLVERAGVDPVDVELVDFEAVEDFFAAVLFAAVLLAGALFPAGRFFAVDETFVVVPLPLEREVRAGAEEVGASSVLSFASGPRLAERRAPAAVRLRRSAAARAIPVARSWAPARSRCARSSS